MTGLTCDSDVSTVLLLDKARRVALTAIGRTLEGKPYDAEEIKEEMEDGCDSTNERGA